MTIATWSPIVRQIACRRSRTGCAASRMRGGTSTDAHGVPDSAIRCGCSTRQWQLGEFIGGDAGSPAYVELAERFGTLTGVAGVGTAARAPHVRPH